MSTLSALGRVGLVIGMRVVGAAIYVAVAALVWQLMKGVGLAVLWLGCSVAYGYWRYRSICGHSLSCDIAGYPYAAELVPRYSMIGLAAFGAASVVVAAANRPRRDARLRPTVLLLGTAAALLVWLAGTWLVVPEAGLTWP